MTPFENTYYYSLALAYFNLNQAKKDKNYALADEIRNELLERGIELMDTREGTKYKINMKEK